MKMACSVRVGNRSLPNQAQSKSKHIKSTLALCKHPKNEEYYIILFSGLSKNGTKYTIKGNLKNVLTKFCAEGKATIQFNEPPHDLFIQSDTIQLKCFLNLFKRAIENKIGPDELTCSSLDVQPINRNKLAPKKMAIKKGSKYPPKSFPRTLEVLYINDINLCSLDRGVLQLIKLKVLDLSHNLIEFLPYELNRLSIKELNVSHNQMGKGTLKQWNWVDGCLAMSLVTLNLSHNNLIFVPDQLVKLQNLNTLHLYDNNLTTLPSGIGNLWKLRVFSASNNRLVTLPGSIKNWRLQSLDVVNNNFEPVVQNLPSSRISKPLPIQTLKECSARAVLQHKIPYPLGSIPKTLTLLLDHAKYCVCGKPCFTTYIKHPHMLLLNNIAETINSLSGVMSYVPIDCYFCSLKCFNHNCIS
ncbi:unnamed protein product [Brassicogethes aeneus]|uniref:PIF1/LRR1 pleckstrin homology domain-containing protein n=1 Tax=Brassicogethes aeneus TaxID=1431903 RepID=A0A9P0AXZ0_BRAAE|nr:unnamed protein product [Brassicogethes aeneus]